MENYKNILDYESFYMVSNEGNVISLNYNKTGKAKVIKQYTDTNGYSFVTLGYKAKPKSFKVHILVWEAFNGKKPNGMQINHIDENKSNNRLDNLELVTPSGNCNYGTRNDRIRKSLLQNHPRSLKCQQKNIEGKIIGEYNSIKQAAEANNVNDRSIKLHCINHKPYKGFLWSLVN